MNNQHPELFRRNKLNPILSAQDWPYPINSVFNAGATRLADGTTLLLCRVEDRRGHSHFTVARSDNGMDNWRIESRPTLQANPENFPEEVWGIEDPRITYLPELSKYAVIYTAFSRDGPGVSLALTEDFHSFERYGVIMSPEDKDAALLPRRIGGQWVLIHRPVSAPRDAAPARVRASCAAASPAAPSRRAGRRDRDRSWTRPGARAAGSRGWQARKKSVRRSARPAPPLPAGDSR